MGDDGRVLERDAAVVLQPAEGLQGVERLVFRVEAEDDELAHGGPPRAA